MPCIFYIGIALVGFAVLVAAIVVTMMLLTGKRLKLQLEEDFGKISRCNK